MRNFMLVSMLTFMFSPSAVEAKAQENEIGYKDVQHNWLEFSTGYETIETDSHEYTYWKNFMRHTRTCDISHKIKTVVYYCDLHNHTNSKSFLEETIHSFRH
ncbi:hypothetical protein ACFQ3N_03520 [Virgibacillus byunsanensis]|uniref:Uncharacterized protein n=1 Tax=Virgibacillus byunsanensis TaxID=570945 RepID=A0ABW3LJS4_9BACI